MLSQNGVSPSTTATYTFEQISGALVKTFGKGKVTKFQVNCQKDESGNSYLDNVLLCIDKNYNPIDCVSSIRQNCPATGIIYPPKTQKSKKKMLRKIFE
jgi:ribonuclease I